MKFKSDFLQEFFARGFFAQATHPQELDEALSSERITAYIGFDCTAKSLHAGSLIQIMILRLLQKHGHKPILLLGGGTTKIGDPSGKDEARKVLSEQQIAENLAGIKKTLEKFIRFGGGASDAMIVNNDDWLRSLNYIEFLRDIGRHFSVNRMLGFDSVKLRLEREQPLSFLEFNYMILQAYDFYLLNQKYGCILQIGGSDQWGNIVNGVELIRRISAAQNQAESKNSQIRESFGLTSPLLTTASGAKMGKTAEGAIWLDTEMLSPFDYFQYFRNTHDADVSKFLKLFTDLELSEIAETEKGNINEAKEILAFEATKICHGQKAAEEAKQKAREIFVSKNSAAFEKHEFLVGKKLTEILKETGAVDSLGEAKRLIEGKAVKINNEAVLDIHHQFSAAGEFDLAAGKKKFFKILIK
jgi:tyrosyl-tRNA synthetase